MVNRIALALFLCPALVYGQGIITTIAGGAKFQLTGIGGPATNVPLGGVNGVAVDAQGNVYVADINNHRLFKIATSGVLTVVAGTGASPSGGDGGPAAEASFAGPQSIAIDPSGNIFVGDGCTVRKIGTDSRISTVAGNGGCGYGGDGGPATQAFLNYPTGMSADSSGNLYFTDVFSNVIRELTPQGMISTVAGNGKCCDPVDGVPATSSALTAPYGVVVDKNGVIYIADTFDERIRRVGIDGVITTIAGGNGVGFSGDGGPATAAAFDWPKGIAVDTRGDILVSDLNNHRVRKITSDGIIRTIAGTGVPNFTGDQGPALLATLVYPVGLAPDGFGNLYIADTGNYRVRRVDPSATITTFAGNGNFGFSGDGGQARDAVLSGPGGVAVDPSGIIYVSDTGNHRVRKIAPNGIITTIAGSNAAGFAGDGGPANRALLKSPLGLALDSSGNLYIADAGNARVRKVNASGTITTIAGNGASPANGNGDGGPALNASFNSVSDVALDTSGNLYIADPLGSLDPGRIRRVSPDGTITTFASGSFTGTVAVDATDNVYAGFCVCFNPSTSVTGLFRISPDGKSRSVVGNFVNPGKIAIDSRGNLYVPGGPLFPAPPDSRVYSYSPSGEKTVVAGTGQLGFSGDDGPATLAQLNTATGVALDSAGNLYIADSGNRRIRKVFLNPASGVFEPTLQTTLQPGYYTAAVTLGQGEHPGYWGMQVLAPVGVLAGGFNLGGTIQQRTQPPGFGGFFLPSPQSVHVHVDAQPSAGPGNPPTIVGVRVQFLDASRSPVIEEQLGETSVDFTQPLSPGYYTLAVRGGETPQNQNFQVGLSANQFAGGVVAGGFIDSTGVGFGGFYLSTAQQVTIQVFGQPTYGADGAGGLRLTLYDAQRNVVATVP